MLSIFVETSCNRYNRDECISCHVYEPLMEHPVSEWHLTVEQAKSIAGKIKNVEEVEMDLREKKKIFDPEKVYKGQPNPTKI